MGDLAFVTQSNCVMLTLVLGVIVVSAAIDGTTEFD